MQETLRALLIVTFGDKTCGAIYVDVSLVANMISQNQSNGWHFASCSSVISII